MKIININLSNNPYKIVVEKNILSESSLYINSILPNAKKIFIITDDNISKYNYLEILTNSLKKYDYVVEAIIIKAGEESKSFYNYEYISETILQKQISRQDCIIALGGGVVGDLACFVASTINRGVNFIQIPTTLLAQVDSSVGGKNGINTKTGKNLIGTFYQPKIVLIDPTTLKTLSARELKSGYAEVLKYALSFDKEFFSYLEENYKSILNYDYDYFEYIISKSCSIKASIVEQDEFETKNIRALLNFGHTFGHIYEKLVNYNSQKITHGEAISLGMQQALYFSEELNLFNDNNEIKKIINHILKINLFNFTDLFTLKEFVDLNADEFLQNMYFDKKSTNGQMNLILNESLGKSIFVKNIDKCQLLNFLKKYFK